MTQTATMGPPLSPRETRRSGRRSAPSASASASKSPDSDQPPREKASGSRTTSSSNNSRNKKLKQEDHDDVVDDRKQHGAASAASSGSNNASNNGKAKRKPKDKENEKAPNNTNSVGPEVSTAEGQGQDGQDEEEEQGITRCVCGSAEDDPDAGEFMVQCETCKVWQHGLCMGYISEDQVHDDDYYCELCKPQMHEDLLRRLAKRPRQTSATSRHDPTSNQRVSRSRSPSHLLKQPSKRRNTMNSRDAAFDESLKEIIEATAAEAAAVQDTSAEDIILPVPDVNDNNKKKRKRTEEDNNAKKRTRSVSTASDGQQGTAPPVDSSVTEKVPPAQKPSGGRNKRGGRKTMAVEIAAVDSEEVMSTSGKRSGANSRAKGSNGPKRPPLSQSVSHGSGAATHEHGTRRNQMGAGSHQPTGSSAADARAYRNSHAYAVSQQTVFTSWNLPDYLSHLEQLLPTDIPQPLEVRAGGATAGGSNSRGESAERTMERGVKVKWPAKRMSVGDMNKRVRALVEWVGREQASGLDRGRRRDALEKALREQAAALAEPNDTPRDEAGLPDADNAMVVDEQPNSSEQQNQPSKASIGSNLMSESALEMSAQTMKMMEELMEELIGFQERFGPGAKTRDRERRLAA